jgi:hypothetical protein
MDEKNHDYLSAQSVNGVITELKARLKRDTAITWSPYILVKIRAFNAGRDEVSCHEIILGYRRFWRGKVANCDADLTSWKDPEKNIIVSARDRIPSEKAASKGGWDNDEYIHLPWTAEREAALRVICERIDTLRGQLYGFLRSGNIETTLLTAVKLLPAGGANETDRDGRP